MSNFKIQGVKAPFPPTPMEPVIRLNNVQLGNLEILNKQPQNHTFE